nr:hypothetical protein [Nanoarchaeum sp.]
MKITEELAELCGIIAGDGHITHYKKNGDYRIEISGDKKEIEYHKYIQGLFQEVFKKNSKIRTKDNNIVTYFHSKKIIEFFIDLGLPAGKKAKKVRIPDVILKENNLSLAFLRGLADTDFSVCFKKGGRLRNSYPRITVDIVSKQLILDVKTILNRLDINFYYYERSRINNLGQSYFYCLDINGKKNLEIWMKNIGFRNKKHLDKIEFWKENGFYNKL